MRLGTYPCKITKNTLSEEIYKEEVIYERHRHRYEVNNKFKEQLEKGGLVISGMSPDNNLIEMIEVKDHPYFVASQFHPEFKSRPWEPAPMFNYFIKAASNCDVVIWDGMYTKKEIKDLKKDGIDIFPLPEIKDN